MEQAKGHTGNNIVTVLMQEKQIDLQASADFVGNHFTELMNTFLINKATLPSWGSKVDADVAEYCQCAIDSISARVNRVSVTGNALGHWVRGNLESVHPISILSSFLISFCSWSFATQRYFGEEHRTIQRTLRVTLYPPQ